MSGCATPPSPPPADSSALAQDVASLTDQLLRPWREASAWRAFMARQTPRSLAVGPLADIKTGEQTPGTLKLQQLIGKRIDAAFPEFRRTPLDTHSAATPVEYLVAASLSREAAPAKEAGKPAGVAKDQTLTLTLVDLRTGTVLGRSAAKVRDATTDTTPVVFFRDSPAIIKPDRVGIDQVPQGGTVPADLLASLPTQALIEMAQAAYGEGQFAKARELFARAERQPGGQQLRVFNGLYLTHMKLGQLGEAHQSFAKLVSFGLKDKSLALKFLFKPSTTDFWPDPAVSGQYGNWIEEIARQSAIGDVCLNVLGHSSRSGGLEFNNKLSLERAEGIQKRMETVKPELKPRLRPSGLGWSENIVGTGTDDATDAVDRRVEFRVVKCPLG